MLMIHKILLITAVIMTACSNSSGTDKSQAQNIKNSLPDHDNISLIHQWEELHLRTFMSKGEYMHAIASSELNPVDPFEGLGEYGVHKLIDNDLNTAWVEGVEGYGTGEYIIIEAGKQLPAGIIIHNGYQKTERLYRMNSRPHKLKLILYAGFHLEDDVTEIATRYRIKQLEAPVYIELEDRMGPQDIEMPFSANWSTACTDSLRAVFKSEYKEEIEQMKKMCPTCDLTPLFSFFIRLEIADIYEGSEWDDTCISELAFVHSGDKDKSELSGSDEKILRIYQGDDDGRIYADNEEEKGIILIDKTMLKEHKDLPDNMHMDIVLMDVSPDKEWMQVDLLFYEEGASRAEEYSIIYNVKMRKRVDETILKTKYGIFGFVEDKGRIWLDTIDGFINLNEIKEKMQTGLD